MSDINGYKNESSIIHISRYGLIFINHADYLEIYSASFEETKDYNQWQDLSVLSLSKLVRNLLFQDRKFEWLIPPAN